jgi:tetratricopeptide (TPR) repeat protein
MGSTDEALPYIERALELDPLNPTFHGLYGVVLIYNRRFDEALAAARKALEMQPHNGIARGALHWALIAKGRYEEQLSYYLDERFANHPKLVAALEDGFEQASYEGAFRALAGTLAEWYRKPVKWVRAWDISNGYLEAGDYDLAINWLEKAYEDHEPNLPYISLPVYEPLRSYPRFQDLLRKMNLPVDEKEKKQEKVGNSSLNTV